jgi:hypothetical protein
MFSFMKNSLKKILVNTRIDVKYKNKQNLCEIKAFERNARKTLLFIDKKVIVFFIFSEIKEFIRFYKNIFSFAISLHYIIIFYRFCII